MRTEINQKMLYPGTGQCNRTTSILLLYIHIVLEILIPRIAWQLSFLCCNGIIGTTCYRSASSNASRPEHNLICLYSCCWSATKRTIFETGCILTRSGSKGARIQQVVAAANRLVQEAPYWIQIDRFFYLKCIPFEDIFRQFNWKWLILDAVFCRFCIWKRLVYQLPC
jgi:hypothetical protein